MAYKNWRELSPRKKWWLRNVNLLKGIIKMKTPPRFRRLVIKDPASKKQRA